MDDFFVEEKSGLRQRTIDTREFYHLTFKEAKAKVNALNITDLKQDLGFKMKMRQFFLAEDWEDYIHSVDISTSGAKGGVLFLYKKKISAKTDDVTIIGKNAEEDPSFVVKFTDAPHQTLFAEYVLTKIGGAKIPKSLVFKLDWQEETYENTLLENLKSPGLKLVKIISTKPHVKISQDAERNRRYNALKNRLSRARLKNTSQRQNFANDRYEIIDDRDYVRVVLEDKRLNKQPGLTIEISNSGSLQSVELKAGQDASQSYVVNALSDFVKEINARQDSWVEAKMASRDSLPQNTGELKSFVDGKFEIKDEAGFPLVILEIKQEVNQEVEIEISNHPFNAKLKKYKFVVGVNKTAEFAGNVDQFLSGVAREITEVKATNVLVDSEWKLPEYLFIMKLLKGDAISEVGGDLIEFLQGKGISPGNQKKITLAQINPDQEFHDKISSKVLETRKILSVAGWMRNLGRALAADTLIGNRDRFQDMNVGNAFFVSSLTKGKRLALFDSDAFLPIFDVDNPIEVIKAAKQQENVQVEYLDAYLEFLLVSGVELDAKMGEVAAPLSDLKELLTNFDKGWFEPTFCRGKLLLGHNYQIINDLYNKPVADLQILPLSTECVSGNWAKINGWIKEGFIDGLTKIQKLNLEEYRGIFSFLVQKYGGDNNNFCFIAFETRLRYLREAVLNMETKSIQLNHNLALQAVKTDIFKKDRPDISQLIFKVVQFGLDQELITVKQQADILKIIPLCGDYTNQNSLIPTIDGRLLTDVEWTTLGKHPEDYEKRSFAVGCALLIGFIDLVNFSQNLSGVNIRNACTIYLNDALQRAQSFGSFLFYKKAQSHAVFHELQDSIKAHPDVTNKLKELYK